MEIVVNKKKILIVFGTRPEAIKMAPLYWEFYKNKDLFEIEICITKQHHSMLDQILSDFDLNPKFSLDMPKNLNLEEMTGFIVKEMKSIFNQYQPDVCLVHGDTTTSFAVALSAFYSKVNVGHVEAGLRTYNSHSPWPEEMNRQLTARLSKYHFAPTEKSHQNLISESLNSNEVIITGNTVIDSLFWMLSKIKNQPSIESQLHSFFSGLDIQFNQNKIVLITSHRRENHGNGLLNICKAIKTLAEKNKEVNFVFPVHLNPNVKSVVNENLSNIKNVKLIEPLNYQSFVYLMSRAYVILTDSGGIQEEAPSLNIPVLVMRENSERPEALESGSVKLVGTSAETIFDECHNLLNFPEIYKNMQNKQNPYGDGNACKKIVEFLKGR